MMEIKKSSKQVAFFICLQVNGNCKDLRHTLNETRTPLIANTVGERIVTQAESSPYVFYNSLNYWQANKATGEWAAKNVGRKAFIAGSFYESGYDTVYAFRHGFEGTGGEVVGSYITHMKPDSDDRNDFRRAIAIRIEHGRIVQK